MQKQVPLNEVLTSEIHHRALVGLLAIGVLLAHLWLATFLMQPADVDNVKKPVNILEAVLLPVPKKVELPPPVPSKAEPKKVDRPKPAPKKPIAPKPLPPKKVEPKKPEPKPVVKTKVPPVDKLGEIAKPSLATKASVPVVPTPVNSTLKNFAPKPTSSNPTTASNPASRPGNAVAQGKGGNSGVVPLVRVPPAYPARAASRHIEGWVKVEFMVNASGTVSSPTVVSSSPPGIFDEAAVNNILKWKFKPKMVNGTPVAQRTVQTIKFTLAK